MSTGTFDEVSTSITADDRSIAARLAVIQEVLEALQTAHSSLKVEDLVEIFLNTRRRFDEKRLVIFVSGLTSSGKSSLLNALLGFDFLFTAPDHCTPCSVSVERSQDPTETFFRDSRDPGSRKRGIAELAAATDIKSEAPSDKPLFVSLSSEQAGRGILRVGKQLRLVDSPGINENSFKENSDLDADAFVFVIDLCSGAKWKDLSKVIEKAGLKTKPVLIVFNKIDQVQRNNQRRFEMERKKRLEEAKKFLQDNGKAADAAIFFLAPKAAVTKRRHDAEVRALRARIKGLFRSSVASAAKVDGVEEKVALLIGSEGSGKTALCADLIEDQLPNATRHSTPCFVMYRAAEQDNSQVQYEQLSEQESFSKDDGAPHPLSPATDEDDEIESLHPQKCFALKEEREASTAEKLERAIEAATDSNAANTIHVTLSKSTLTKFSLLQDFSVIDTPPLEDLKVPHICPKHSVLIVVVCSDKKPKEMQDHIKRCLDIAGPAAETHVFLAVTKWKEFCDQHVKIEDVEERKRAIQATFHSCLQCTPSGRRKVFFVESEVLMEEYESSFAEFETRLIRAAHDEFASFKLGAVKQSVAELLEEIQNRVARRILNKEETEAFYQGFADEISDKFLKDTDGAMQLSRTTRAHRFISSSRQLPDTESQMKALFGEFMKYYKEDVTKEILKLSQKVLKQCKEMDSEARENVQRFHEDQMHSIEKQLALEGGRRGDIYGLRSMLENFMILIPKPFDETENRMKIKKLMDAGDKLILQLKNILTNENETVSEMQAFQQKWNDLKTADMSSDEALVADHIANLKAFVEEIEAIMPRMKQGVEIRNISARETRTEASKIFSESMKRIGAIEYEVKESKVTLSMQRKFLNDLRKNLILRFLTYLFVDFKQEERLTEEQIKSGEETIRELDDHARVTMERAKSEESDAQLYEAEFKSLLEKKNAMNNYLDEISFQVKKYREDRRNIVEEQENVDDALSQQHTEGTGREEAFIQNPGSSISPEEKFLEKTKRWNSKKTEYYLNLLSQLEEMSNVLLRRILFDFDKRTRKFLAAERDKLKAEKASLHALRGKLSALSCASA